MKLRIFKKRLTVPNEQETCNTKTAVAFLLGMAVLSIHLAVIAQGEPVGWVTSLSGKVYYTAPGTENEAVLQLGQEVQQGTTIITKRDSAVRLLLKGDNVLTISQNTKMKITQYVSAPRKTQGSFDLIWGRIRAAVAARIVASRGDSFEIKTKNAVAGVRGSFLGVDFDPRGEVTRAGCGAGDCYVRLASQSGRDNQTIPERQLIRVTGQVMEPAVPLIEGMPGFFNPQRQYDGDGGGNDSPADENLPKGRAPNQKRKDLHRPQPDLDPLTLDNYADGEGPAYYEPFSSETFDSFESFEPMEPMEPQAEPSF